MGPFWTIKSLAVKPLLHYIYGLVPGGSVRMLSACDGTFRQELADGECRDCTDEKSSQMRAVANAGIIARPGRETH